MPNHHTIRSRYDWSQNSRWLSVRGMPVEMSLDRASTAALPTNNGGALVTSKGLIRSAVLQPLVNPRLWSLEHVIITPHAANDVYEWPLVN